MAFSTSSALILFEKKVAFDAVIGVLGVFTTRVPGGVAGISIAPLLDPFRDWILAVVGVLSGSKFIGGNRRFGGVFFAFSDFLVG